MLFEIISIPKPILNTRNSLVTVTGWKTEESGFDTRQGQMIFFSPRRRERLRNPLSLLANS
jgi:hypothetical protein